MVAFIRSLVADALFPLQMIGFALGFGDRSDDPKDVAEH
jgi:hypothetical protein